MNNQSTPFSWPLRIYYEDTDASGVVYHANYLKYFERARSEWLRALGFEQQVLRATHKIAFVVASTEIDFRQPALLDDEVVVTATLEKHRHASLVFGQTILRNETLLAQGRFRIGCIDASTFQPCAIPTAISREMQ